MKQYAEQFYKSTAWKNCRNNKLKKAYGLCEVCFSKGLVVPAEEVHHKIHITPDNINDPNITLNENNLVAVCRECHRNFHGKPKRYEVDEWGRVKPR